MMSTEIENNSQQFEMTENNSVVIGGECERTVLPIVGKNSDINTGRESSIESQKVETIQQPLVDRRLRTKDVTNTSGKRFEDFSLDRNLLKGIYYCGWDKPSPIQEECIPLALSGASILARAKNGTGKTGAYCIPVLAQIDLNLKQLQAIIVVPTRELALQTAYICTQLSEFRKVNVIPATGGSQVTSDLIMKVREAQVVITTPGRIISLFDHIPDFSNYIKIIVLDEADKLLSFDFRNKITLIMNRVKNMKQVMLFSATFPDTVKDFTDKYVPKPRMINLMERLTLRGITQYYAYVEEKQKIHCLNTLFSRLNMNQAIIFCNTTQRVELLAKKISDLKYSCYYIHAKMQQEFRSKVFHDFKAGYCRNLVCSDLFTRGIDCPNVNVVINFDFPSYSETYLHRIGRSGRFGHLGIAINLITYEDRHALKTIENELNTVIKAIPKVVPEVLYVSERQYYDDLDDNLKLSLAEGEGIPINAN